MQGVGFRPFVYRLANDFGLAGYVQNRLGEVDVVASGPAAALESFSRALVERAPPLSQPRIVSTEPLPGATFRTFEILASSASAAARIFVPPDCFMCEDCRAELDDPHDRRYRYPFINCTQCGPRYTLIESLPYDRPNTSMADFPLCDACDSEYRDPADRRFHAEPVACPDCGPAIALSTAPGASQADALESAVQSLREGLVLGVKGIGGYHLMCDAANPHAVRRLRERKRRPDKPLAVMFPLAGPDGLDAVRRYATLTESEADLLAGPMRPIVLVAKKKLAGLAGNLAPGLSELGAFLPYSPLHQLLLDGFGAPLVATSGNVSGDPVLTEEAEATTSLAPVADVFLHHNRRIVRPADDSVYRRIGTSMRPVRIGRGSAPCELELPWRQPCPTLAVGGHMKAAVALSWEDRLVMSPHIGEMDSPRSLAVFERVAADLQALYGVTAERIACDAHPAYTTHRWARRQASLPVATVWHHHAHASALAAEFGLRHPSLVFTWDGTGLGEDGTLWGGEALLGVAGRWRRVASLRPFRLPGGERAGREPWRSAASLAWECGRAWTECPDTDGLAKVAWERRLNCPVTSAAGRLFDAAAAFVLDMPTASFEAAGPMRLEALCRTRREPLDLPLAQNDAGIWQSDWEPLLDLLCDAACSPARRAEIFHSSLARTILDQARAIRAGQGVLQVGLTGGVFQNRVLTEQAIDLLQADGFRVFVPSALPCNDAALCVGQAAELASRADHCDR